MLIAHLGIQAYIVDSFDYFIGYAKEHNIRTQQPEEFPVMFKLFLLRNENLVTDNSYSCGSAIALSD
jgi:hypothetical protein